MCSAVPHPSRRQRAAVEGPAVAEVRAVPRPGVLQQAVLQLMVRRLQRADPVAAARAVAAVADGLQGLRRLSIR